MHSFTALTLLTIVASAAAYNTNPRISARDLDFLHEQIFTRDVDFFKDQLLARDIKLLEQQLYRRTKKKNKSQTTGGGNNNKGGGGNKGTSNGKSTTTHAHPNSSPSQPNPNSKRYRRKERQANARQEAAGGATKNHNSNTSPSPKQRGNPGTPNSAPAAGSKKGLLQAGLASAGNMLKEQGVEGTASKLASISGHLNTIHSNFAGTNQGGQSEPSSPAPEGANQYRKRDLVSLPDNPELFARDEFEDFEDYY